MGGLVTHSARCGEEGQDCNPAPRKLGAIVEVDCRYKIAPWVVEAGMARKSVAPRAAQHLLAAALAEWRAVMG